MGGTRNDKELHRYMLNGDRMLEEMAATLRDRGYHVCREGSVWKIETTWDRGAACGEVGSILYLLVVRLLESAG